MFLSLRRHVCACRRFFSAYTLENSLVTGFLNLYLPVYTKKMLAGIYEICVINSNLINFEKSRIYFIFCLENLVRYLDRSFR